MAIGLAGCSFEPAAQRPAVTQALPEAFAQADAAGPYRPSGWWRSFQDPTLTALIDQAVQRNFQLEEAIARVEQAAAQRRVAGAGLIPDVTLDAQGQYQNQPADAFAGGFGSGGGGGMSGDGSGGVPPDATAGQDRISFDTYSSSLQLSYELDFWGRVRNSINAAEARLDASVGDLQTALLSVITNTIRAYLDIAALEQRLDLSRRIVGLLEDRAQLTERRYQRGLVDSFELYSIRGQLRRLQASLPQLENQIYAAQARLAVLIGSYPEDVVDRLGRAGPLRLRIPAEPIPPGLPPALLIQRPDVRAAWLRLEAQRRDVGVQRAALFPQVTLSGGGGLQGGSPQGLVDPNSWFANFIGNLTAPLFTGGRIRGQIAAAEAGLAAQGAAYARTVLTAFEEVETALKDHETALRRYRLLKQESRTAEASADLQLRRYREGTGSYLGFLDARRNFLEARREVVQAERGLAEARLSVHRALGGAWVEEDLTARGQALIKAALGETEAGDG
ncbi:MAG: efflux transporter outer membrane subunit [Rhodothalassiaceae bacterium]